MARTRALVGMGSLILFGCGAPALDGTTDESLEASAELVRESLAEPARAQFDSAYLVVAMSGLDFSDVVSGGTQAIDDLRDRMDGLSASDVIAMADSIREAERLLRVAQAREEIQELETKKAEAAAIAEQLSAFVVERSRFSTREREYLDPEVVIELTVRNGLDVAISRAYFSGTLQSPSRSVPWVEEDFNYTVPGGVEPGETASWRLTPNLFGEWRRAADAPADAVLTVTVERLDGPDGEPLGGVVWSERDEERLEALRASVRDLDG